VNTLTVWSFAAVDAAERALGPLDRLIAAGHARVDDAALVAWPSERRTPATRDLGSITGAGALWGGFWGMLLSLIFLTPLAGPAFGAGAAALAGTLQDFGLEDDFLKRVRDGVTPGTSALFLLSSRASADAVAAGLRKLGAELLRCELSPEQEQRLRDALSDD
jgi:uncharacterized membrane protein